MSHFLFLLAIASYISSCICASMEYQFHSLDLMEDETFFHNKGTDPPMCTGYLWKLNVVLVEPVGEVPVRLYARYWPVGNGTEPLDPYKDCSSDGARRIQMLQSKIYTMKEGVKKIAIFLYRVRSNVTYAVEVYDGDSHEVVTNRVNFTPYHRDCHPFNPRRNTSYGYFTDPLILFNHLNVVYWMDQTGAIVHMVDKAKLQAQMTMIKDIDTYKRSFFMLHARYLDDEGNKKMMFIEHGFGPHWNYCFLDMSGHLDKCYHHQCTPSFHHEAFFDPIDKGLYLLSFNDTDIFVKKPGHVQRNLTFKVGTSFQTPCGGYSVDSSVVWRYDVPTNKFKHVFSLPYTYNNSRDSMIDITRDLDTDKFSFKDMCNSVVAIQKTKQIRIPANVCQQYFGVDIVHANSFKRALDGSKRWVLSFRHTNSVLLLDEHFEVKNVIGGRGTNSATFRFQHEQDRFYGQHEPWLLDDGSLLMWDNGLANFSRAVRYELDTATMKAKKVWQFNASIYSGIMSGCCGSATMNDAGNVVCHDSNPRGYASFNIVEADGKKDDTPIALVRMEKLMQPEKTMRWRNEANNYHYIYRSRPDQEIDGERVVCAELGDARSDVPIATTLPTERAKLPTPGRPVRTRKPEPGKGAPRPIHARTSSGHVNVVETPPARSPQEKTEDPIEQVNSQHTFDASLLTSPLWEVQWKKSNPPHEYTKLELVVYIIILSLLATCGLLVCALLLFLVRFFKARGCFDSLGKALSVTLHSSCELAQDVFGAGTGSATRVNATRVTQRRIIFFLCYLLYVLIVLYVVL